MLKTLFLFGLLAALAVCFVYLIELAADLQIKREKHERELNSIRMETAAKAQQGAGKRGVGK